MFYIRKNFEKNVYIAVELFDEKTNNVLRVIRFRNSKDFDKFLEDFRLMRYPGYGWRYLDKKKK